MAARWRKSTLASMLASDAREEGVVDVIAAITGLAERTVRNRLEDAHGKTLVCNVFADRWQDEGERDRDALGGMTVSEVLTRYLVEAIASTTGLEEPTIQRRLESAHGKTLVRNVFSEHWRERSLEELAALGAAEARLDENAIGQISEYVGLEENTVRRRLDEIHGKTLVRNVFDARWGDENVDVDTLGNMSVAEARDAGRAAEIAGVVELSEATVCRRLDEAHGRTLVRNVFGDRWPGEEVDVEALGNMSAAEARDADCATKIAGVVELSEATVRRRIDEAHGRTLIRNVFEDHWPGEEVDTEALGDMSAAEARDADRVVEIAGVVELSEATVRRRLDEVHGRTLVRNVFEDHWPSQPNAQAISEGEDEERIPEPASDGSDEGDAGYESPGQGRDEHRQLQDAIAELGRLRTLHVRTDKPLPNRNRPDVAWFQFDPDQNADSFPRHVFEIEFGGQGARAKSLQSLLMAYQRWNSDVTLIVPERSLRLVSSQVPVDLVAKLKIHTVEECMSCIKPKSLIGLARVLEIPFGTRR